MVEAEVHSDEVPLNDLQNREASMCLGNAINLFINVIIISFFKHSMFSSRGNNTNEVKMNTHL